MSNADHEKFLARAIELSARAALEYSTGGVFGAVVVRDGKIVAEHAEMEAIRLACITLQSFKLPGGTLYTAGEPCPMCMATAYWAEIDQIFYSATVEDAFTYGQFDDHYVYKELALPPEKRKIRMQQMLREKAVEVWKQYQAKPDKVPY
jgi:guanine deaminase